MNKIYIYLKIIIIRNFRGATPEIKILKKLIKYAGHKKTLRRKVKKIITQNLLTG